MKIKLPIIPKKSVIPITHSKKVKSAKKKCTCKYLISAGTILIILGGSAYLLMKLKKDKIPIDLENTLKKIKETKIERNKEFNNIKKNIEKIEKLLT
jgi:hypothetical protein